MTGIDFQAIKAMHPLENFVNQYAKGRSRTGGVTFWQCPFHPEKTPSFKLTKDGGAFVCFGCGAKGDLFDFLKLAKGLDLMDAIAYLSDKPPAPTPKPSAGAISKDEERERNIKAAKAIWCEAGPAEGTPVDAYLRSRGITIPIPPSIRHHPNLLYSPTGQRFHGMVAAVQAVGRSIVGIHRTFLLNDGRRAQVSRQKMMLAPCKGGAIRLGPVTNRLVIAEGIETALSYQQLNGVSTWAAMGASFLPLLVLPHDITDVTIAADGDPAGRSSASNAADKWRKEGINVTIEDPGDDLDYNDILQRGAP